MHSDLNAYLIVNESMARLAKNQNCKALFRMIEVWTGCCIPSARCKLSDIEMSTINNIIWLGCIGHDCLIVWKRLLRWPHAPLKYEAFIMQRALYGSENELVIRSIMQACHACPGLIECMAKDIQPSSLITFKAKSFQEPSIDYFWGDLKSGMDSQSKIHSLGAIRAVVLNAVGHNTPTIRHVLAICKLKSIEFVKDDEWVNLSLEWALSPSIPKQYSMASWHVLCNLLKLFPPGHFSCDFVIDAIACQIEKHSKRPTTGVECMVAISECLKFFSYSNIDQLTNILICLCTIQDARLLKNVFEIAVKTYSSIPDEISAYSISSLSKDELRDLAVKVCKLSSKSDYRLIPYPLTGDAIEKALHVPIWIDYLLGHATDKHVMENLLKCPHFSRNQYKTLAGILAHQCSEGLMPTEYLDALVKIDCSRID